MTTLQKARRLDPDALKAWPLPPASADGDKETRGRVLVVGGSREIAGAVILAATATLRAGAGKLTVATAASVSQLVASAVPEARVIGLPETPQGGFAREGVETLAAIARQFDAVLVGPGMQDEEATCAFVAALLPQFPGARMVLDAAAMDVVRKGHVFSMPALLTPHPGEMAHLCGSSKDEVLADAARHALDFAKRWNVHLALKAATTWVATPEGTLWEHRGGTIGLATSGSGDALAGIITGLAARGASLEQAAVYGIHLHAAAGRRLAERIGPLGFLAREISAEVPVLMHELAR